MPNYDSNTRFPSGLRKKVTELTRNSKIVNPDILAEKRDKKLDMEYMRKRGGLDLEGRNRGFPLSLFYRSGRYPIGNPTIRGPLRIFPEDLRDNRLRPKLKRI